MMKQSQITTRHNETESNHDNQQNPKISVRIQFGVNGRAHVEDRTRTRLIELIQI